MNEEQTNALMIQQIQQIEKRDDNQIIGELAGLPIDDLYYEVKTRKGKALKLSWAGTKQAAQDRGNISLGDPDIIETEDHWRIVFRATDLNRNISIFGGCHQPKQTRENGTFVDDPYAFQKAISKAQRNALNALLPMTYIERAIKLYVSGKRQPETVKAPGSKISGVVAPPAAPDIGEEEISTFNELEKIAWNKWRKQPSDMIADLGYNSRVAMISSGKTPYDCYLELRELYGDA